jgi:hypothetical protein
MVCGTVLVVGDGFEPGGAVVVSGAFEQGEMGHEVAVGGAVPVAFSGRGADGVAGAHANEGVVAGYDEPDSVGNVQGLAEVVGVPVGADTGGESHEADDNP